MRVEAGMVTLHSVAIIAPLQTEATKMLDHCYNPPQLLEIQDYWDEYPLAASTFRVTFATLAGRPCRVRRHR